MAKFNNNNICMNEIMNEPIIPTQDAYEAVAYTKTNDEQTKTNNDDIDDFDFDIDAKDLAEILKNDADFINNTLHEATTNQSSLSQKEIQYRLSKVPEHKLKCNIDTRHVSGEEARALLIDNKGDTKYYKSLYSTAVKFFLFYLRLLTQICMNTPRLLRTKTGRLARLLKRFEFGLLFVFCFFCYMRIGRAGVCFCLTRFWILLVFLINILL